MYVYIERCEDKDPQCGGNPGWPQSWCTDKYAFGGMMYDEVNEKCPKMCGHCGQSLVSLLPTCIYVYLRFVLIKPGVICIHYLLQ